MVILSLKTISCTLPLTFLFEQCRIKLKKTFKKNTMQFYRNYNQSKNVWHKFTTSSKVEVSMESSMADFFQFSRAIVKFFILGGAFKY